MTCLQGSSSDDCILQGGTGSLAASLDYAISKEPNWLTEMFGVDVTGRPVASRIFKRSNSGRKLPGPVTIALNPSVIGHSRTRLYWDAHLLTESDQIQNIATQLGKIH